MGKKKKKNSLEISYLAHEKQRLFIVIRKTGLKSESKLLTVVINTRLSSKFSLCSIYLTLSGRMLYPS